MKENTPLHTKKYSWFLWNNNKQTGMRAGMSTPKNWDHLLDKVGDMANNGISILNVANISIY